MVFLTDEALDQGLDYLNVNGEQVNITNAEATTYTEAITTFSLGQEASASVGAPVAGDTSGRKVIIAAISAGVVDGTDTASHWALVDVGGTELLAAQTLNGGGQSVTSGNTFSLGAIDIEFPDPA